MCSGIGPREHRGKSGTLSDLRWPYEGAENDAAKGAELGPWCLRGDRDRSSVCGSVPLALGETGGSYGLRGSGAVIGASSTRRDPGRVDRPA